MEKCGSLPHPVLEPAEQRRGWRDVFILIAAVGVLLGCDTNSPITGATPRSESQGMQTVLLISKWARVTFMIETRFLGGHADELVKSEGVGRLPNHFQLYRRSGERRFGLDYRPSGQIELDGGFLLTDTDRKFPIMIECHLRPDNLPTRCQLWQRRERGLTLSIFFNGSRLDEWETTLAEVEEFVVPRIIKIEPQQEKPRG